MTSCIRSGEIFRADGVEFHENGGRTYARNLVIAICEPTLPSGDKRS